MSIAVIKKRDGRIVPFDMKKISDAIEKSFRADTEQAERQTIADQLAWEVTTLLEQDGNPAPAVERIQDLVEHVLMSRGYEAAAKRFILYRQARTDARTRAEHGSGTVILEPWEPTLTGQAVAICAAIRNNGGADRLVGFFESLAPAAENTRSIHVAIGSLSLLGPAQNDYLKRQADLLCGTLGCARESVETAQAAALAQAEEQTEAALRQTLRCLHARGCTRELTARPETLTPAVELLLRCEE